MAADETPAARLARLERVPQARRWVRAGAGPDPPPIDASFDLPDPPQLLLADYAWLLRVARAALAVDGDHGVLRRALASAPQEEVLDRPHVTVGLDCWCGPRREHYGADEP